MSKYIGAKEGVITRLLQIGCPKLLTAYLVMVKNRQGNENYTRAGAKTIATALGKRRPIGRAQLDRLKNLAITDIHGNPVNCVQDIDSGNNAYNTEYSALWGSTSDYKNWYLSPPQSDEEIHVTWTALENERIDISTGEINKRAGFVQITLDDLNLDDEQKMNRLAVMLWFFKNWDITYNGFHPERTVWMASRLFADSNQYDSIIGEMALDSEDEEYFDEQSVTHGGLRWCLVNNSRKIWARNQAIVNCAEWRGLDDTSVEANQAWYFDGIQAMQDAALIRAELVVMNDEPPIGSPLYTLYRPLLSKSHNHNVEKKGLFSLTAHRAITEALGMDDELYAGLGREGATHTGFFVMAHTIQNTRAAAAWVYRLVDNFSNENGEAGDEEEVERQDTWKRKLERARATL